MVRMVTSRMIRIVRSLDVTGHGPHGSLQQGQRRGQERYVMEFT